MKKIPIFIATILISFALRATPAYADGIGLKVTVRTQFTDADGTQSYIPIPNAKIDWYGEYSAGWEHVEGDKRIITNAAGNGEAVVNNCNGKSHHLLLTNSIADTYLPPGGYWKTEITKPDALYASFISPASYTDFDSSDPWTYSYPEGCSNSGCWVKTGFKTTPSYQTSNELQAVVVALTNNYGGTVNITYTYVAPIKIRVAGCYYNKKDGEQITGNSIYPTLTIHKGTGETKEIAVNAFGCFSNTDFITTGDDYAVRPSAGTPIGFQGSALTKNNTQSNNRCTVSNTPTGSPSYECQSAGNNDCGQNCDFAFEPNFDTQGIPDCTNLSGPTTLNPGQTATYKLTASDAKAPVSAVEMSAYGTNCSAQARPYTPQLVSGGGEYSFDWTAPSTAGVYTVYGRVWNNNISECRADCVDVPPRYLCASAQQCKLAVTVGNPKTTPTTQCAASGSQATFSWKAIAGAKRYVLRIDKVNTCVNADGSVPVNGWFCGTGQGFPNNTGDQYIIYKPADVCTGGNCQVSRPVVANDQYQNASVQWVDTEVGDILADGNRMGFSTSFSCPDPTNQTVTINGTVREGSAQKYGPNNYCVDASKPAISTQGRVSLSGTPTNTYNLAGNTTFAFTIPADSSASDTRTLSLSNLVSSGVLCSCESGCNYTVPTGVPGTYNYDFFVSNFTSTSWWQASGGHVYAKSGLASLIPATCSLPSCNPFLILKENYPYAIGTQNVLSAGIPISPGGLETGTGNKTQRTEDHTAAKLTSEPDISPKENYEYFAQKAALNTVPAQTTTTITELSQLNPTVRDGVFISHFSGALTLAPTATWNITGGGVGTAQKYIIFADSVTIKDTASLKKLITVAEGGYFMVIAKNGITVDFSVGDLPADKTVNLEGVYVADGPLIIKNDGDNTTQDLKFIGAGTFVSWTNITLDRKFADGGVGAIQNNTSATEFFIFRPDFMAALPEMLKDSRTVWREIR